MCGKRISWIRFLIMFVLVGILTAGITLGAVYASEVTDGECGNDASWSYDDGTLTISGNGMMSNYRYNTMPWYHLKEQVNKVVIGEGITHVVSFHSMALAVLPMWCFPRDLFLSVSTHSIAAAVLAMWIFPKA